MLRLLLISLLIVGCAKPVIPERIVTKTQNQYIKIHCPGPPSPSPISIRPPKPRAVTDEFGIVWVGLTPKDYEKVGIGFQELIRYIKDQKGVIKYYVVCIDGFNADLDARQAEEKTGE